MAFAMPAMSAMGSPLIAYGNTYADAIFGPFTETVACLSEAVGRKIETAQLPLPRADQVLNSDEPVLWYPDFYDPTRSIADRLIGPAAQVSIYWYQRRKDSRDVTSRHFMETATVATPKGSRTGKFLSDRGYHVVWAPFKPGRSVARLLSGDYDALVGSDYGPVLDERVMQRMRRSLYARLPVGFRANKALKQQEPDLLAALKVAIGSCGEPAKTAPEKRGGATPPPR
ncbi:hypothetical protein [Yunchengibacter salinarum]|uniref:hypothetical protein n=1 Tax=Yunchengibacter salinarum TaxID=3133399 RepID=UPI0035B5ABA8